jgi:hypothetical protein
VNERSVEAIRLSDGSRATCLLRLSDPAQHPLCEIQATLGQRSWTRSAADYFEALALIRRELEADGWLLSCYGASKNVYPSAMARDMGRGLKAYKTYLGQRSRREDLVDIFATGPDVEPASVDEQIAFHRQWPESLGLKR